MNRKLIIKGINDEPVLTVYLDEILNSISNGNECYWKILWIKASGSKSGMNVLELEKLVNNSSSGYIVDFQRIKELAIDLFDIIDITIIGSDNCSVLKRYNNEDLIRKNCMYCIQLIDSSYWEISSSEVIFTQNLIKTFPGAIEVMIE